MNQGQSTERYRRIRSLGHGAMGEVWLAEDTLLDRMVAIKQLLTTASDVDHRAVDRIRREARTVARLHHPNIVGVYDLISVGGHDCLVMEYVDGVTLAELMEAKGSLPVGEVASVFIQLAHALDAAHRAGIVHRDVKPTNIIVTGEGVAKLADFGIARGQNDDALTATGHAVGTIAYMAPEIGLGDEASAASDMWSMGAAMYAALEGHAPHDDPHRAGTGPLLRRRITEAPSAPTRAGALTGLLGELLAADPSARPIAGRVARELARTQSASTQNVAVREVWEPGAAWSDAQSRPGPRPAPAIPETDVVATPADVTQLRATSAAPPARPLPPQLIFAALAMLATAVLVLVPIFDAISPTFSAIFSGNEFERAFGMFSGRALAMFIATALGFVLLAVGLLRGRRAAQVLTCALCALVITWQIDGLLTRPKLGSPHIGAGVGGSVIALCALVALLVLVPPSSRAWFAADARGAGFAITSTVSGFGGAVAVVVGFLLSMSGELDENYVWTGLGTGVAGIVLLACAAPLAAGRQVARGVAVVADLGLAAAVIIFAVQVDQWESYGAVLPLGVLLVSLIGLIALPASKVSTARGTAPLTIRRMPLVFAGTCVAVALVATSAAVGFTHRAPAYSAAAYEPDYSAPYQDEATQARTTLDSTTAESAADDAFQGMVNNGTYDTCDGNSESFSADTYQISDVSPQTDGTFIVSAPVTLDDGSTETVSVTIGTDSYDDGCVLEGSLSETDATSSATSSDTPPADVPDVPSSTDDVPTDSSLPDTPSGSVYSYDDTSVPTSEDEIVEYAPDQSSLDSDQYAAVQSVISFMTYINQQDFESAYAQTVAGAGGSSPGQTWRNGWLTSRYYQAAFGEPVAVGSGFMIVPSRWISRQNPNEQQARLDGSTCDYWPQYMFLMKKIGGSWYFTNTTSYDSIAALSPYDRPGDDGSPTLNPVAQRVDCS